MALAAHPGRRLAAAQKKMMESNCAGGKLLRVLCSFDWEIWRNFHAPAAYWDVIGFELKNKLLEVYNDE